MHFYNEVQGHNAVVTFLASFATLQQQEEDKAAHEVPYATSAVASLTKWMRECEAEAPPNLLDDLVALLLSLRRVLTKPTIKPHLLLLSHPFIADSVDSVCVISDDHASSGSPSWSTSPGLAGRSGSARF